MIHGDCENDRVSLREVPFARFMELEQWFEDPELHAVAARYEQFDALRLYRRIFCSRRLQVWDIFPPGASESVGYATLYSGIRVDPSIYVYFFDDAFDDAVAQDVTHLLVETVFARTDAQALDYILPVTAEDGDDPFVRFLVGAGFDANDGALVDERTETCFTLLRSTYDAYCDRTV